VNDAPRRIDIVEPGYFALCLVKRGPLVPARILCIHGWWAAEIDGEIQNPQSTLASAAHRVLWVWERGRPIRAEEWQRMTERAVWARTYAPHLPEANPTQPINLATMDPLF
jgi:hypothetical protein